MKINNTQVVDTYAEAFSMCSAKVIIITAESDYWALGAAQSYDWNGYICHWLQMRSGY